MALALCLGSLFADAQLTAKFTATDTAGCAPLVIRFVNKSTGALSYKWDLGTGDTSALTDASESYLSAGTYTVTLTARNGSSSASYSMVIRIYNKPAISFSANDTAVCENSSIIFTSTSTPSAWGGLKYIWNFGDGGSSTAASPSYSYPSPGYYNITLFATNVKGCSNSLTLNSYIDVFSPANTIFSAVSTTLCSAPGSISFINATTGKPSLKYTWLFGDGGSSTAFAPSHVYTAPASYDVKLIVHDGNGCTDSSLQLKFITVGNLKAGFSSPANGCSFAPVTFKNASTAHISSQWYFGDGGMSVSDTSSYAYAAPGTYNVKLVIFDGSCYDSVSHPITISSTSGSFSISPHCGPPYSTQTFKASVPAGSTVLWDFGDSTTGAGITTNHTYNPPPYLVVPAPNPPPVYKVAMIMTSSLGCIDTVTAVDTVKNLVVNLSTSDSSSGCLPFVADLKVTPVYLIINPAPPCKGCDLLTVPYPYGVISYSWDFGDGSPIFGGAAPIHTFTATGIYTVRCTVVTADGCSATNVDTIKVGTKQKASFILSKKHVCAGQPITYTSTSVSASLIDNYSWNFGDGVTVGGPPSHGFNVVTHRSEKPGVHNVILEVFYNGCKSGVDSLADTIDAANATIADRYTCIPSNGISFADSSIGDDTHLWQFGDGDTSTAPDPVHFFPALSSYNTVLTTYNAKTGCRDTSIAFIELKRLAPTIKPYHLSVCRDVVDSITTFIKTTDSTQPVKATWYTNGLTTDTDIPQVFHDMTTTPPFVDTIFHPMHIRGNDTVTLIITDNHGCFDTASDIVTVVKPIDSFSLTPPVTCPATSVIFTDHSADIAGFTITRYSWSFGDGTSASSGTPVITHTYTAAGTYTIKETVTDNLGCSDTLTGASHPLVHKPAAAFIAGSTYNCNGTTINFNNTSTGGVSWLWMFGDGATSTVSLPSHTYTTVGSYTVKLVAFDAYGCTDTAVKNNLIAINPIPVASFYMDDSFAVCAPLNVNFINTSTGAPFCSWTFGDGNSSLGVYPSDIYTSPGVYTVKLKATNSYGCFDTAVGHATVFGSAGGFKYTPASACASVPVHFSATISGVSSVVWDFNDGFISTPSTDDTISHAYMTPGKYLPKLILTDLAGCSSFSVGIDTIKADTVTAKFSSLPEPVCQNNSITFHDSSSGMYSAPAAWLWSFGSGATSTAKAPVYTYTVSGSIPVTLLVTNGFGCSATVTKNVTVNPVPDAITGTAAICNGQTATLTEISSGGAWTSTNTSVATIGSAGILTSLSPGTSTIAYTLVAGCKTTTTETVNPLPLPIKGVKTICAGDVISLGDPTPGGTWTSSNTAAALIGTSGVVTGVATGTTTITYQVASGCLATAIVKVDSSPVLISGRAVLCAGDTISLSDVMAGGIWSSSNTSAAIIDPVTGTVSGTGTGTATITYTLSTGCKTTTTITTNPVPAPITGNAGVCKGLSTSLTDATSGGTWSSRATVVATVSSGVVAGVSPGTTTISYSLATGCFVAKAVTVNPLPASVTGPASVCVLLSAALSDITTGGSWSSPDPAVTVGSTTGVVTGITTGTATVTYTLTTGCIATKSVTVDPVPAPISGTRGICLGLSATLTDDTTRGTWNSPDPAVTIGSTSGIVKGVAIGTATISYVLPTGCFVLTTVTVNPEPAPIKGSSTVCAGSIVSLSDSVIGGIWSSGLSSVATISGAGLLTGIAAGSSTITYTSGVGCSAITTVTVFPVVTPINGTSHLCKGTIITLSDSTTGGIWSTSDMTIASISTSGAVTGLDIGTTIISYYAANTCDTSTAIVRVDPLPDAGTISGNTKLCTGVPALLTDSITGGLWTTANSTIATVDASGSVTGVSSGTTNISYSYTNSCGTAKTSIALTINQTPPAVHISTHPDSLLCTNTLYQNFGTDAPEPPGLFYTWSAQNAIIYAMSTTRQYCLVSFPNTGTAIVKLSSGQSSTGCVSWDSLMYRISGNESPNPQVVYYQPEFICKDNTADNYQWGYDDVTTLDSTLLYGMVNQNYYNQFPDFKKYNYWVLTYHDGCLQKSYYNTPTGINIQGSENTTDIIVYPNPAGSEINIEIRGVNKSGLVDVRLYDILGKERLSGTLNNGAGKLTLSALPSDVYMLLFSRDGIKIGTKMFIKN